MKRSRHAIISQILEVCCNGASKTRIVYQANLNFRTVDPYIKLLITKGLIESENGKTILYKTTNKGLRLRESFKQIDGRLSIM